MNDKPISDLHHRMLEDMAVRRLGEKTRHDYIKHIETFTRFFGRSPDAATAEDLRRFQVHELEQGGRPPKMNTQVSALRFFFGKTLGRLDLAHGLFPRRLPAQAAACPPHGRRHATARGGTGAGPRSTRRRSALPTARACAAARW